MDIVAVLFFVFLGLDLVVFWGSAFFTGVDCSSLFAGQFCFMMLEYDSLWGVLLFGFLRVFTSLLRNTTGLVEVFQLSLEVLQLLLFGLDSVNSSLWVQSFFEILSNTFNFQILLRFPCIKRVSKNKWLLHIFYHFQLF